jgi:hypothetical protein
MDKNFVNVDDLVRQRLGGGEERERSGAWQNMRELLDKEMPQERPVGFFYWRRMLSALTVLLLVGAAGVGGYKAVTAVNGDNAQGTGIASVSNLPEHVAAGNVAANNTGTNEQIATTATDTKDQPNDATNNKQANDDRPVAVNGNNNAANNTITNNNTTPNRTTTNNVGETKVNNVTTTASANTQNSKNNTAPASGVKNATTGNVAADNTTGKNNTTAPNSKPSNNTGALAGNTAGSNNGHNNNTASSANTAVSKVQGNDRGNKNEVAAMNDKAAKNGAPVSVATNNKGNRSAGNSGNTGTPTSNKGVASSNTSTQDVAIANKTTNETKAATGKNKTKKNISSPADATSNVVTGNNNTDQQTGVAVNTKIANNDHKAILQNSNNRKVNKTQTVSVDKMALGGHTSSERNLAGTAVTENGMTLKSETGKSNGSSKMSRTGKPEKITGETSVPVFVTRSGKKISGDKLQKMNIDKAKQDPRMNCASSADPLKGKRLIQKMALVEHFIKTTPGEGFYKLDTVSIVTLSEELGMTADTKSAAPVNSNKSGNSNSSSKNKAIEEPQQVVPEAAPPAKAKATHSKESTSIKKTSGQMAMENLSAAFNDVKYHMAGMQFAPGLTAGINSTFFGPNSLKGFQFGFEGNFIFSDKVSAFAEFKYFHRINNNYSVNDNYYTYTANGNGGYNKELQMNSYGFSALHSFELPMALCFTEKKFSFFAGGNFVYSFAINTGAARQADPASVVTTTSIGNDNAPKLSERDFSSRFGIGYLFGVSYKVSHNVNLDLRSVQTVWDNSRSSGSKTISSQLYKSPSMQLSFGYRLGGAKR